MHRLPLANRTDPNRTHRRARRTSAYLVQFLVIIGSGLGYADPAGGQLLAQLRPAAAQEQDGMVQLNFGTETDVRVLVDYVSQRLGVKILYDEQINDKKITIKAPGPIPASSLLQLLQSVLKMKGLALVDADVEGWKRIHVTTQLPAIARNQDARRAIDEFGPAIAVTQTFELKHFDPQKMDQIIKPFLTPEGANSITLADPPLLIVTDYATNILRIAQLIETIDVSKPLDVVEFYAVRHTQAEGLAQQVTQLIRGAEGTGPAAIRVTHDPRTNQLILAGDRSPVDNALKLIRSLDIPLKTSTKVYAVQYMSAEELRRLAGELVDPSGTNSRFNSTVDAGDNLLIVEATPEIHQQIEMVKQTIDLPTPQSRLPVQFYQVKNVTVTDILNTLKSIEQQTRSGFGGRLRPTSGLPLPTDGRIRPARERSVPGPNRLPGLFRGLPPTPPAYEDYSDPVYRGQDSPLEPSADPRAAPAAGQPPDASSLLGRAQVSADPGTNTLIVVAEPAVQRFYAELIRRLDKRRPQVLIEAKVVIINTSDDFSLGVEVSGGDSVGAKRLFSFSSFGLSNVDPLTGALALIPGTGFNGTLVDPEVADVVVRALTAHNRARVVSAPRVLVNDNATGLLTSVDEVPFTSVNASQTVATTSFAGFAEAGTTITVTPHIGEGGYLQLDYQVSLNTFTGTGGDGIPPPRQTDEIQSEITIPDGHTLIVGGLSRSSRSQSNSGLPFVELLPLGRYLGGLETRAASTSTLFVFIKPIILRDDKFADLKFLSHRDMHRAKLPPRMPSSQPLLLK